LWTNCRGFFLRRTNMVGQLRAAQKRSGSQVAQLREAIKPKNDAHLASTNQQARLDITSKTLSKVKDRPKEFEAKKNLIELEYRKKQPSSR